VATSNLVVSGTANTINLTALPVISNLPSTNILIQSAKPIVGAFNFVLGAVPSGYTATINTNLANTAIQLVVTVAPAVTKPTITSVTFQTGPSVLITGTNGTVNSGFFVLSSTNLALPINQWVSLATNTFNSSGNFSVSVPVSASEPQRFYRIQSQ
jgi:hypothetical protein